MARRNGCKGHRQTVPLTGGLAHLTDMRRIFLFSLILFAPVHSIEAQRVERNGWAVRHAAHVDLWYHSLAVVGFQGFGAVPLYDPGYAPAIRAAKTALGIPPTTLDREAPVLLEAFRADSIFEVLHFLPVYFALASRVDMLDALDAVSRDPTRAIEESGPRTQFGVGVAGALLPSGAYVRAAGPSLTVGLLHTCRLRARLLGRVAALAQYAVARP